MFVILSLFASGIIVIHHFSDRVVYQVRHDPEKAKPYSVRYRVGMKPWWDQLRFAADTELGYRNVSGVATLEEARAYIVSDQNRRKSARVRAGRCSSIVHEETGTR